MMFSAQIKPKSSIKSVREPQVSVSKKTANSEESPYIMNEIKLSSLFLDNKIPADFPKKDPNLSFEANKLIAIQWSKANKILFKEKYQTELDSMNF